MTLTEYLNQEDPVRHPTVYLEEDDYTAYPGEPHYDGSSFVKCTPIVINGLEEYVYLKFPDQEILWTIDEDGNPKSRSVFRIKMKDEK